MLSPVLSAFAEALARWVEFCLLLAGIALSQGSQSPIHVCCIMLLVGTVSTVLKFSTSIYKILQTSSDM